MKIKNNLFVIAVTLLMSLSYAQQTDDMKRVNLKGKVKFVKVESFVVKEDSGKLVKTRNYSIKFNKQGYKTEIIEYDDEGNIQNKYTYKYDNKRNLIEECNYNSDQSYIKYNYKYTKDSIFVERIKYDSKGTLLKKEKYATSIDVETVIDEFESYDVITYKYKYDLHGNWIKKNIFTNGKLSEIIERQIIYY